MTGTVVKGKALREDLNLYDGLTLDGSRPDASGGTFTGLRIEDDVDVLSVYGGGSSRSVATIDAAVAAIGTANVGLRFAPGTWTIDSDLTLASNFSIIVPAGCVFDVSAGVTLTINGALLRYHGTYTSGSGTVTVNGTDILGTASIYDDYAADTGTADTYVIAPSPAIGSYAAGQRFRFKAGNTCTGASTLNVSSLGAKSIKKDRTADLESGDITADDIITVHYDGTNFQIQHTTNSLKGSIGLTVDTITTAGNALLDDADAAAQRATMGAMQDAFTTRGDMVYEGATNEARLPVGTEYQVIAAGENDPGYVWPAFAFVEKETASASPTIEFTDLDQNSDHLFVFRRVLPVTDSVYPYMHTSRDSGTSPTYDDTSDYNALAYGRFINTPSGDVNNTGSQTANQVQLSVSALIGSVGAEEYGVSGFVELRDVGNAAGLTSFYGVTWTVDTSSRAAHNQFAGHNKNANVVQAVRFTFSSGNISSGVIEHWQRRVQ